MRRPWPSNLATFSAPAIAYLTIAVLTFTTFVFGGFMREQVCIYMCPWPRIQGAMMDEGTLTVGYRVAGRAARQGHQAPPRGGRSAPGGGVAAARYGKAVDTEAPRVSASGEVLGDCIDCNACVAVCPMGIDIREGQQMECITCALCIDACDDVMAKIGKPRGLIDYLALTDVPPEGQETSGWQPKPILSHILRMRTLVYTTLWSLVGVGLLVALFIRPEIEMTVAPVRNPTFVTLSDGTIRNTYDVRLRNKNGEERLFALTAVSDAPLALEVEGAEAAAIAVPADSQRLMRVYLGAAPGTPAASAAASDLRLWVEDMTSGERAFVDTTFNGREN